MTLFMNQSYPVCWLLQWPFLSASDGIAPACEHLKDQFIFGVTIHDVQDNLLMAIKKDDGIKNAFMKQGR